MVAGNAVQGLGDVSCPLQNDLLRRNGSCFFFVIYGFLVALFSPFDACFMAVWLTGYACGLHSSSMSDESALW